MTDKWTLSTYKGRPNEPVGIVDSKGNHILSIKGDYIEFGSPEIREQILNLPILCDVINKIADEQKVYKGHGDYDTIPLLSDVEAQKLARQVIQRHGEVLYDIKSCAVMRHYANLDNLIIRQKFNSKLNRTYASYKFNGKFKRIDSYEYECLVKDIVDSSYGEYKWNVISETHEGDTTTTIYKLYLKKRYWNRDDEILQYFDENGIPRPDWFICSNKLLIEA